MHEDATGALNSRPAIEAGQAENAPVTQRGHLGAAGWSMPADHRFPPPSDELDAMAANLPMTAEQAATLRRLAEAAYELEAFKSNLTRAEADLRIAALTAKLTLLDGPPHTL